MGDLAESWNALREEIDSRSHRLVSDIADAWSHVQSVTQMLAERLQSLDAAEIQPVPMEFVERLFSALAERLLIEPLTSYRRKRPLLSVVSAIREYEAGLEGVVHRLPVACKLSRRALLALPGVRPQPRPA